MMDRRELLKLLAITGGAALAPRWIWATGGSPPAGQRLITLFLRGAADGLTVCAPLAEAAYFDARPSLAVRESEALVLDHFFGLHPAAAGFKALFDQGELAFVHATGLASAQRSHFEAQSAMEQGVDAFDIPPGSGWLSRYLSHLSLTEPLAVMALDKAVPQSLEGYASALAVGSIDQFGLTLDESTRIALTEAYARDPLLKPTAEAALTAADALAPIADLPVGEGYPDGPLGIALADTARLIRADTGLFSAAINSGGWDHHDNQLPQIEPLLGTLAQALVAFRDDIGEAWKDTTVVIQTEFGRRLHENASGGTDHGHGGVMLIAGGDVNGGSVITDWPGLGPGDLSAGEDLAVTIDYRQILAELLTVRFGATNLDSVLNGWAPGAWHGIFNPPGQTATADLGVHHSMHASANGRWDHDPGQRTDLSDIRIPELPSAFRQPGAGYRVPISKRR